MVCVWVVIGGFVEFGVGMFIGVFFIFFYFLWFCEFLFFIFLVVSLEGSVVIFIVENFIEVMVF